ncbi:hypothetical protein LguiA_013623 [Lonicera macranthoides]
MTKATAAATTSSPSTPENSVRGESSVKGEKKKKHIIPKLFTSKKNSRESSEEDICQSDGEVYERQHTSAGIEGLNLSTFDQLMGPATVIQDIRIFVATWNVGGKTPNQGLNLEDFLQVEGSSDIYILGFQEIVPLSAGNVLVIEDNEPAAKWLALISQALNKPYHESTCNNNNNDSSSSSKHNNNSKDSKSNFFHKPNLKVLSRNLMADSVFPKACNCPLESPTGWIVNKRRPRKLSDPSSAPFTCREGSEDDFVSAGVFGQEENWCNILAILEFLVWGEELWAVLATSHLASGEKEGDELKRNTDVAEILKSTQFPKICKNPNGHIPEKILDHDRIIWLGDLNYRVSLSYEETRVLLEDNNWDTLLEKDQLNLEREAGRVFKGWKEGRIYFAPTYKYSQNSDSYAGETVKSKKKRRTPAWCDRILWRGDGIEQLSYIRGESRFSDHRPVCAVFAVEVEAEMNIISVNRFRKGFSCAGTRLGYEDALPRRHSFYEC